MSAPDAILERECVTLGHYLVGVPPDSYVRSKYLQAHVEGLFDSAGGFDRLLMRLATSGRLGAKLADSYARIFSPTSLLRRKLVLLLAILETCAPSFHLIDELDSRSRSLLVLRMSARVAGSVLAVVAATPFLLPAQMVLARKNGRSVER